MRRTVQRDSASARDVSGIDDRIRRAALYRRKISVIGVGLAACKRTPTLEAIYFD
jgi:hypothetical protein